MTSDPVGWREAMERALYGPGGFFTREDPADHFRTSVHASALYARAVARLLRRVDEALGRPERLDVLDIGAGRGELLSGLLRALEQPEPDGAEGPDGPDGPGGRDRPGDPDGAAGGVSPGGGGGGLVRRVRAYAAERGPRPAALDPRVEWLAELPPPGSLTGLVFANEWLDNVPVDVVETDGEGVPRRVLTDAAGNERLGGPPAPEDAAWLARWWPLEGAGPGARAEIGHPRDTAWTAAVRTLRRGAAVAVDYGHTRENRPPFGTLTGFRAGRETAPVPDGSADLTAHVALDAVARAVSESGTDTGPGAADEAASRTASSAALLTQREALRALGVTGARPPLALASSDPAAYVRALGAAGEAAELTDPGGLGGFGWLVCGVGIGAPLP